MSERQLLELDTRHDALVTEARVLVGDGSDPLEGDALERFTEIESEIDALRKRRGQLERLHVAVNDGHVEAGTPQVMTRVSDDSPAMDRALDVIDRRDVPADNAEQLESLLRARDPRSEAAEWVITSSDRVYEAAFSKLIRHPRDGFLRLSDAERAAYSRANETRAAMSLTGANGGFLVPFTLDPAVIISNTGVAGNPIRQIARTERVTTDDWNGVTSAGVTAEWLAEAAEAADASPTFTQPTITVHKAAAYLQASIEVAQDSNIGDQIAMLIADAKDRLEEAAFTTGSGSGQPWGVVTRLAATTASRVAGSSGAAGAADLVVADTYAMIEALPARHRRNASWLAALPTINSIRKFATGTGPQHAFITDLADGSPPQLLGKPLYESTTMDSTIVSGSNDDVLVVGDFRNYVIADRVGLAVAYNPLVVSTGSGRPTGSVGWFAFWRTSGDLVNTDACRLLRL